MLWPVVPKIKIVINFKQDGDGFEDFAVGSPYEDNDNGAVRIFFGRSNILEIQGYTFVECSQTNKIFQSTIFTLH